MMQRWNLNRHQSSATLFVAKQFSAKLAKQADLLKLKGEARSSWMLKQMHWDPRTDEPTSAGFWRKRAPQFELTTPAPTGMPYVNHV